jgi:glycosyltransferase involved in cell wall biosynthesis
MVNFDEEKEPSVSFLELDDKRKQLICFLGTFPPRECGIATFTKDLAYAIKKRFNPKIDIRVAAINEEPTSMYNYNRKVGFKISQNDIDDYIELAKKINRSNSIKIVSIQHEFGIFGGEFGNNLIPFLEALEKPVVVTFHSVLPCPAEYQKKVVKSIGEKSSAIVVMAEKAVEILTEVYGVDKRKIYYVPHGTPQVPFCDTEKEKKRLGLQGKKIFSTFGLLNRGKGIEYILRALPKVVEKHPDILYLIIGETHPVIRRREGEKYRNDLIKLVEKLGIKDNVRFYNKYLSLKEIISFLKATDVYLSPGLDKNQIVSGTLAYAISCGKPVISTGFLHAKEIVNKSGAGFVVDFKNPEQYKRAILKFLDNPNLLKEASKKAYSYSRHMTWPNVAQGYMRIFEKFTELEEEKNKFPQINLKHLIKMTNKNGMIQFANHSTPDLNSGYTLDDNARALIVVGKEYSLYKSKNSRQLAEIYLNFIEKMQREDGRFYNYLTKELKIKDKKLYQDPFGRALWALGSAIYYFDGNIRDRARKIFEKAVENILWLKSVRAKAFSVFGIYLYDKVFQDSAKKQKTNLLIEPVVEEYKHNSRKDWRWFEEGLTYANSTLPEAFFIAYKMTGNHKYLKIAKESFDFLCSLTFVEGNLMPIGQNGWFSYKGKRAFFDQQPIDASSTTRTCLVAHNILKDKKYADLGLSAFNWFLGKNSLNQFIYDSSTGGCYDGLSPSCVNINQGAESTLSYLMSRLCLEELRHGKEII